MVNQKFLVAISVIFLVILLVLAGSLQTRAMASRETFTVSDTNGLVPFIASENELPPLVGTSTLTETFIADINVPIGFEEADGTLDVRPSQLLATPKFLTLPFPNVGVQITQGWVCHFSSAICGLYTPYGAHNAIDYARFSGGNAISFDLLATAPGNATCYPQSTHPVLTWHYGNIVQINHTGEGTGYSSIYAHLASCEFTSRFVQRGERIGAAGTSGQSSGIHLHFELRTSSTRVDPYDLWTTIYSYPQPGASSPLAGPNHYWTTNPPTYPSLSPVSRNDWNLDGHPDVFAINKATGQSGKTEVHILSGASNFQSFLLNTATALHQTGADGTWVFVLGDYNRDGKPDLYAINRATGQSGKTEVHILNGADNFKSFLLNTATALHQTGSDGTWIFVLGDYNGDGHPDLYAINKATGQSGKTEVHILNGADNFKSFLLNTATGLNKTGTDGTWVFVLGDYNRDGKPDLYAINKATGQSGKTEVHILNGADNFKSFLLNTATVLPFVGSNGTWAFNLDDRNRDGTLDLYAINRATGQSGKTEVHILNGADRFQTFLSNIGTTLHTTGNSCGWDFVTGQCIVLNQPLYRVYLPLVRK